MGNKAFLISSAIQADQPEALLIDSDSVLLCCDYSYPLLWLPMFDMQHIVHEEQEGKRKESIETVPIPYIDKQIGLERLRASNDLVREILAVDWDFSNQIRMLSNYIEESSGQRLCIEPGEMMSTKDEREDFLRCLSIFNGDRSEGFREHILDMTTLNTSKKTLINPYNKDERFYSGIYDKDDESNLFGIMGYGWYHDNFPWTEYPKK